MNQKQANHYERIRQEVISGIAEEVMSHGTNADAYQNHAVAVAVLSREADGISRKIVNRLLRHYTIRERAARK